MYTDDLTPMAYEVLVRAHNIVDVLRIEIGVACAGYETEDLFLQGAVQLIEQRLKGSVSYLDFWKYLDAIDVAHFKKDLKDLKKFIFQVMETPLSERGMPPFM